MSGCAPAGERRLAVIGDEAACLVVVRFGAERLAGRSSGLVAGQLCGFAVAVAVWSAGRSSTGATGQVLGVPSGCSDGSILV